MEGRKTLDLIITHYKSPFELGRPFFDMVALQRNIDFNDVGVILVNDGEESALPDELFKDYPYKVTKEVPVEGAMKLMPHSRDVIFIHGKLFRKKWLDENNLRFRNGLTLHEDVFLNTIAQAVAPEDRIGEIKTGWYLWCHNPASVGRSYKYFLFETYDHLMIQRNEIAKEFKKRGMEEQVKITVCKTVVDAYYDFQTIYWLTREHKKQYEKNERWFCAFLKKYAEEYATSDVRAISNLMAGSRDFHIKQGCLLAESITLGDWLKHMMNDVRPIDLNALDVEP